jgi:rhodanese-related sulfurtransferase/molybdopterin-guanine dinucleotide biosynthesis protein A
MGRDKATIGWPRSPWAGIVADAVRGVGVEDVLLVGGDRRLARIAPWVPDDLPGAGPAAAVATLARHRPGRPLLVCACDLPDLTAEALEPVVAAVRSGAPAAVPLIEGRSAWSVVAIGPDVAREVVAAVDRGVRSMRDCLGGQAWRIELEHVDALRDRDRPVDVGPRPTPASGQVRGSVSDVPNEIPVVDVAQLAEQLEGGAALLDVRTTEEIEEVRVPGVVHIPLDELELRLDEVPEGDPLLVICRSGARSMNACVLLAGHGRSVANVEGGTLAWIDSGRPVESGPR